MPVRYVLAVALVLACVPTVIAQSAIGASTTTVSAPQSIYIWKAETPIVPGAGTRYWRIQGAAGSAVDATKKTIGRLGGDGAEFNAGMLGMFTNMLLKGTPIAAGFVPWSFVPEKAGDVCLIEKGKTPFDEPSAKNPSRFVANKEGGWANPSGVDLVLFAPIVSRRPVLHDSAGI